MDDLEKRKIYNLIQLALQSIKNNKFQIVSYSPYYVVDGTSGVKFTVQKGDFELTFFAGFSTDKKYSEKLLFGILKSESNDKIEKLNLDKDGNGNNIQEKFSLDEKFLAFDNEIKKAKLSKWLSEQITTVFVLYRMWNKLPKKNKTLEKSDSNSISWFKTVELPWLIALLGIVPTCFCPVFAESNEKIFMTLAASGSLIFLAGVIAIIATIGKKREIRIERKLPITKNPYTWFISYIGKAVCGTAILCLGIGIFILIAIFSTSVSSSLSGGSSSSSNTTGGRNTSTAKSGIDSKKGNTNKSTSTNKSSIRYYYCEYCGHKEINLKLLLNGHCNRHPTDPYNAHHKLYEGTIKSDYYCKYCGHKERTIEHLTSGYCQKYPNGSGKGHHQPAL